MSQRPTNFYPAAPKPEWFMRHASNMTHVNLQGGDRSPPPGGPGAGITSDFQKMDASAFNLYLDAHDAWMGNVLRIDGKLHDEAVKRRLLEKITETAEEEVLSSPINGSYYKSHSIPGYVRQRPDGTVQPLVLHTKVAYKSVHAPQLSVKPHQAEKRANKKKARDAATKAKANFYEAKAEVTAARATVPAIKERLEAVSKVTEMVPLHKAELVAAKSAAARAKQIQFGTTSVTEVDTDGWKLVTRKNRTSWRDIVDVKHIDAKGAATSTVRVSGIPELVQAGRIAAAAAKAPQTIGAPRA